MPDAESFTYQVRKCRSESCGMRYPCQADYTFKERCPRCGAPTDLVGVQAAGALERHAAEVAQPSALALEALLDNVRSAWNVGSIFRSADGAGFSRLHLCGVTPTPEYPPVLKTSLGAEKSLPWTHHLDGLQAASRLIETGRRLWALENDPAAGTLYEIPRAIINPSQGGAIVLVVGNEVCGVDAGILALCERVLYLPMRGLKRSYNVAVAFGIAAHYLGWLAA